MASLRFEVSGDEQLDRTLMRWDENVGDFTPVWRVLAADFVGLEQEQFASQGARSSGRWSPLTPRYAAWKAGAFPGRPILERTGDLVDSLTSGSQPEIAIFRPHEMTLGTGVPYARFHQHGTSRMPRRRPIELTEADRNRWVKALQAFLVYDRVEVGR